MSIARRVQKNLASSSDDLTEIEEIKREEGGKKYAIMTVDYMAEGHDGYDCMKGSNYIINDEEGQIMGTLIRSYLLGLSTVGFIAFHLFILKDPQVHNTSSTYRA